jgi:hypothetical protein
MRSGLRLVAVVASVALLTACGLDLAGSAQPADDGADAGPARGDPAGPAPGAVDGGGDDNAPGCDACDGATATLEVVVNGSAADAGVIVGNVGALSCPGTCAAPIPLGATVKLSATPLADEVLVSWSGGGCVGREPSCNVTVDAPKTVTATFTALTQYVHSPTRLYRVDGATGVPTPVADFAGPCAGVNVGDIAIDRTGAMVAITLGSTLYPLDATNATCGTAVGSLGHACNALAFMPDPAAPTQDILVAACGSSLYRVNRSTGAATLVGAFGGGLSSSGDVVYVPGAGLYATLSGAGTDRLGKIDPATGVATVVGDTGKSSLYGLGYRAGKILAFGNGTAFTLDLSNGAATSLNAATGVSAYGAASGP